MKKPIINTYRKFGIWGFGIAAALSPIAIAASCGSSDAPTTTSIDTSQVSLNAVSVSGTVASPEVSLGGTFLPTNTALLYKIGSSEWLNEADFKAYVVANAASLTDADLSAVKARLVPSSNKYALSAPKEVILSGKITRAATTPTSTSIDTSGVNLSVITVSGTTNDVVINLNGFAVPTNTALRFQVGTSAWLNEAGIKSYIATNAATLTAAQLSAVKARLEPSSAAYTLTSSREVTLNGTITNPATTPATPYRETLEASLATKDYFATDAISSDTKPQVVALDPIAKSYQFLYGDFSTLAEVKAAPASEWQDALPSSISFAKAARHLWLRVTVKTMSELGTNTTITNENLQSLAGDKQYFDLTSPSRIQSIRSDVAQQASFTSLSLSGIQIIGNLYKTAIKTETLQLPEGATLEFVINNATRTVTNLAEYISQNRTALTTTQLDNIVAKVAVTDEALYALSVTKQSILKYVTDINFAPLTLTEWTQKYPQYADRIVNNELIANAFSGETLPSDFTLPNTVTRISSTSFRSATLPAGFALPSSVTKIDSFAFSLTTVPAGFALPPTIKAIAGFEEATLPQGFIIPNGVERIEDNAFRTANLASDFTLPASVIFIGANAFNSCRLPASFRLPTNIQTIGNASFFRAIVPVGFTVPAAVKSQAALAFTQAKYPDGSAFTP